MLRNRTRNNHGDSLRPHLSHSDDMAPKKKQHQQQKQKSASSSKNKPQSSSTTGPKLQISAENENRLRRLLLDSGRSTAAPVHEDSNLTKAQKAKKLHSVYEKLSCEGFTDDHIERALSHLKVFNSFYILLINYI